MEKVSERVVLFWLGTGGISAKKLNALLEVYAPCEIWNGIEHEHFEKVLGEKIVAGLRKTKKAETMDKRLQELHKLGVAVVTRADEEFPTPLNQREVNPPAMLYCKGDISLLKTNCIAVIGARKCTRYGKDACEKITRELVAGGVTVVSGLATGIDAYAHAETLSAGGKTIAVLGAGFEHIYPPANFPLYQKILRSGGLVVSEYPPGAEPQKYTFPERNRLISGLSMGLVVVEAGMNSGTLITAGCALEQGREVFAIPGNITSPNSEGTNNMIQKNDAKIVLSAKQIFEELRLTVPEMEKNTVYQLDFLEQNVYNFLESEPRPFDELLISAGVSAAELTVLLSNMELKGIIKRLPSNYYSR